MFQAIKNRIATKVMEVQTNERGADAFEYLLVIGVVVVAVIGGMTAFPGIITTVITEVTTAIEGLF
jgi:Flp pilus assembly pilin Flp